MKQLSRVLALFVACRPKQWAKNIFVFTPLPFLIAGDSVGGLANLSVIFVAYCMAASSVYLVNDVLDVQRDRVHPTKRHRPVPAGLVPARAAVVGAVTFALASIAISAAVNLEAFSWVAAYLALAHLYTVVGKHIPILDVALVGSFYGFRVIAGFSAVSLFPAEWFIWVVLACLLAAAVELGKRKSEAQLLGKQIAIRRTLSFYTDAKLAALYGLTSMTIIAVYPLAALSINTTFLASSVLVALGLRRFWVVIGRLREDLHPQMVILGDWQLVAAIVAFSGSFTLVNVWM